MPFSDSGSEAEDVPSVPTEAPDPAPQIAAAEEVQEEIPAYDELPEPEWSQTECHMNVCPSSWSSCCLLDFWNWVIVVHTVSYRFSTSPTTFSTCVMTRIAIDCGLACYTV